MSTHRLDVELLHRRLDAARLDRRMTWRAVSRECDLSTTTVQRVRKGLRPDADSLLSLLAWSGLDAGEVTVVERARRCDCCGGVPPTGFGCLSCGAEGVL